MKFKKFINEKEKKKKKKNTQIDVIYMNINVLNVKYKRIEKALFNVFALRENNYINVNMMYISKKDDYLYIYVTFLNELND